MVNESLNETVVEQVFEVVRGTFQGVLTTYVVALLIVLVGFIIGKLLGKLLQRLLAAFELDRFVRRKTGMMLGLETLLGNFVSYFIYFISIVIALDHVGLKQWVLNFISFAVIVLVALSLVLGIKDFIPNILAGFIIVRRRNIKRGDIVEFQATKGEVVYLSLLEIRLQTSSGDLIHVPNAVFIKQAMAKRPGEKKPAQAKNP